MSDDAATPVSGEPARCNEAGAFVVTGHYCATDANPQDAADEKTAVVVATREEAENWLLWYPGGEIIPARLNETTHVVGGDEAAVRAGLAWDECRFCYRPEPFAEENRDALAALDRLVAERDVALQERDESDRELLDTHNRAEAAEAEVARLGRCLTRDGELAQAADAEVFRLAQEVARLRTALEHLCVWVETGCDHYASDLEAVTDARSALSSVPSGETR